MGKSKIYTIKSIGGLGMISGRSKKKIKVFEDKAGNKLFKKWVKTRGVWQWTVTNREGKLVNFKGVKSIIGKAKRSGILSK